MSLIKSRLKLFVAAALTQVPLGAVLAQTLDWQTIYHEAAEIPHDMHAGPLGAVVVGEVNHPGQGLDYLILNYDPAGTLLWSRSWTSPGSFVDIARAVTRDASGNVLVTGDSNTAGPGIGFATIKYSQDGDLLWVRRFDLADGGGGTPVGIATDQLGNVYVGGTAPDDSGIPNQSDMVVVKYSAAGDYLWHRRVPSPKDDEAIDMVVTLGGYCYITGTAVISEPLETAILTAGVRSDGSLAWSRYYSGPAAFLDRPDAIAFDPTGGVVVAGEVFLTRGGQPVSAVISYDLGGSVRWARQGAAPVDTLDVVVDGSGASLVAARVPNNMAAVNRYDSFGNLSWTGVTTSPFGFAESA